jgi:hypothetical protein
MAARSLNKRMRTAICQDKPAKTRRWFDFIRRERKSESHDAELAELSGGNPAANEEKRGKHEWTMTHSFYVVMGGFVMRDNNTTGKRKYQRVALNIPQVEWLQKNRLTPDISEAEIMEKSKTDSFSMALTCLQAIWFCAQCITRMAQGIGISLLEMNTFVHCIAALLTYIFWWQKPKDINEPIVAIDATENEFVKALALYARLDALTKHHYLAKMNNLMSLSHVKSENAPPSADEHALSSAGAEPRTLHDDNAGNNSNRPSPEAEVTRIQLGQFLYGHHLESKSSTWPGIRERWDDRDRDVAYIDITAEDVHLLGEVEKSGAVLTDEQRQQWQRAGGFHNFGNRPFIPYERFEHHGIEYEDAPRQFGFMAALTISGLVYGCLHMLAWNGPFLTSAEQELWRMSTVVIGASGLLWPLWATVSEPEESRFGLGFWLFGFASIIWPVVIKFLFPPLYIMARLDLVVECYINLVHLPDGDMFRSPNWSLYIPHIS